VLSRWGWYVKAKHLITSDDAEFFEMLPVDGLLSTLGVPSIDIIALDEKLSKEDPDYNGEKCTYKGNTCSLAEYISIKYGERCALILREILE
jgi:hypothetical protein